MQNYNTILTTSDNNKSIFKKYKKSENLTFSLIVGIWRDLEYTNKLSPRCHIQQWAFFNLFFHTLKSPNFTIRKNKAKMLLLKNTENATQCVATNATIMYLQR